VAEWFNSLTDHEIFISVLTIGEIRCGIDRLQPRDPSQAMVLNRWLQGLVDSYADRILPVDHPAAEEWGRLNRSSAAGGRFAARRDSESSRPLARYAQFQRLCSSRRGLRQSLRSSGLNGH
jgi:predicted nucleic acid-binding protein